jgi:predicted nicotinamide N-methyase
MDDEEPWIEDGESSESGEEGDQETMGFNLFDDPDPHHDVELSFGETTLKVSGKLRVKFPHLLESTGLALWDGSRNLCNYLCAHKEYVQGKNVLELGAGLGVCGILAHKLGAKKVVLTDGDTATLVTMRLNVATNSEGEDEEDFMVCKQLRWGRNIEGFREKVASEFDTIMGGDIIYAQEGLQPLFQTVSKLLSEERHAVFLQSYINRNGVTMEEAFQVAKSHGLQWLEPEHDGTDGVYVFYRKTP